MTQEWHYSSNGQQHGPISAAELKQRAASGQLKATDSLWKQGMANWIPAASVKGLFPSAPAAAAPPPLAPAPVSPPPVETKAPVPAGAPKQGLVAKAKERLQSPEVQALAQKAKSKWQGTSKPVKFGVVGGALGCAFVFLLLTCALPLAWVFGGGGGDRPERRNHGDGYTQTSWHGGDGGDTSHDDGGDSITEDFLPHKVGAVAEYDIEIPNTGTAKHRLSYESGGQIADTTVSIAEQFVNRQGSPTRHVVRDGFVGELNNDGNWVQCLKLGAKQGDTWERSGSKYEVEDFGSYTMQYDNKQRDSVTVSTDMQIGDGTMHLTLVYVKGIGLLSKDGDGPVGHVHWQLKEQKKEWRNLTKAERAFYE